MPWYIGLVHALSCGATWCSAPDIDVPTTCDFFTAWSSLDLFIPPEEGVLSSVSIDFPIVGGVFEVPCEQSGDVDEFIVASMRRATPLPNAGDGKYIFAAIDNFYQLLDDPLNFRCVITLMNDLDPVTLSRREAVIRIDSGTGFVGSEHRVIFVQTRTIDAGGFTSDVVNAYISDTVVIPVSGVDLTIELDSYADGRQLLLINGGTMIDNLALTSIPSTGHQGLSGWWDVQFGVCADASSPLITAASGGELCDPAGERGCIPDITTFPLGATNPIAIETDFVNVWTANYGSANVSRMNRVTRHVTTIALTGTPKRPIALAHSGDAMWVANDAAATVWRIDGSSLAVTTVATGTVGANQDITYDNNNIWACGNASNKVIKIDPITMATTILSLPGGATGPVSITAAGANVWVGCKDTNNVVRINRTTHVMTTFALPGGATGPDWLTTDTSLNEVWCANYDTNNATSITSTGVMTNHALPVGATGPLGIAYDGVDIWVSCFDTDNIARVTTNGGPSGPFTASVTPRGIITDGDGSPNATIWTADFFNGSLTEFPPCSTE